MAERGEYVFADFALPKFGAGMREPPVPSWELPKIEEGGGPAGVKDLCVNCDGGGPAGVVDGWFSLGRCEPGVDGGEESGTLNILASILVGCWMLPNCLRHPDRVFVAGVGVSTNIHIEERGGALTAPTRLTRLIP